MSPVEFNLSALAAFIFIYTFTPGPGNIVAFSAISRYKWKKGWPMIAGIVAATFIIQLACALAVYYLGAKMPQVIPWLKHLGVIYLLWLAYSIYHTKNIEEEHTQQGFLSGFFIQLANMKVYLFGITVQSVYIEPFYPELRHMLLAMLCIATVEALASLTWAAVGGSIGRYYNKHIKVFNAVLALALVALAVSLEI